MGSQNKILGSDVTCYPTYLDPWVPLFCIFSLWRPATSVKMNGYLRKLNWLFVWIRSNDWYLNWPNLSFISRDVVHWQVQGGVDMRGVDVKMGRSTSEKTIPPKKNGVRRCLGELGGSEGPQFKCGTFFSLSGFRFCFVVLVGEFESSVAVGFRCRVCSCLL